VKFLIFIICCPVLIFASGGEHGGNPWLSFLYAVINFVLFAWILVYFAGKKIKAFFEERERTIREEFNRYKSNYEFAESEIRSLKEKISKLEEEKKSIEESYEEKGEVLYKDIVQKAKNEAIAIRIDAEKRLNEEIVSLRESIVLEFIDSFITEVEKRAKQLDETAKNDLKREFIELLGNVK